MAKNVHQLKENCNNIYTWNGLKEEVIMVKEYTTTEGKTVQI